MKVRSINNQSGQALLLVLLAMAAITTLSLSIVSRSITQVEVTNRDEEALRAYSAAEAGVEKSLTNVAIGQTVPTERLLVETETGVDTELSNYEAEVTGFPEDTSQYSFPFELYAGETGSIWFATPDDSNPNNLFLSCTPQTCYTNSTFEICWGDPNAAEVPAIELSVIYQKGNSYHKAAFVYDAMAIARGNNFRIPDNLNGSCSVGGQNYAYSSTVDMSSVGIGLQEAKLVKVRSLYNTTVPQTFAVRASSGGQLPPQGKKVSSTGRSGSSARKIEAFLLHPQPPSVFGGAAVISKTDLTK